MSRMLSKMHICKRLAKKYLKRPAIVTIGEAGRAVDTVEQKVEFVIGDEKKKFVAFVSWFHEHVSNLLH